MMEQLMQPHLILLSLQVQLGRSHLRSLEQARLTPVVQGLEQYLM